MHDGWLIASKVLAVFAVMGAGVFARWIGWLSAEADKSLLKLTVNVLLPCLFFGRVVSDPALDRAIDAYVPPLVGFGTTVLGFVVAGVVAAFLYRMLKLHQQSQRRAFTLCTGMYNYGYIPLPIALTFFPDAVTTLIIHNVGVEIAFWTVGVLIISGSLGRDWWKKILNGPVIAITVALALKFGNATHFVPTLVSDGANMLGVCAIPMGLVLSGAVIFDLLREGDWLDGWRALAMAILVRVVLLPMAFLYFAKYMPMSLPLKQVVLLQAAMPAATFPLVVTKLYGQDTPTAFRIVVGTTLLGVVTIPAWIAVGCWYLEMTL